MIYHDNCRCKCKKSIKHLVCKNTWNSSTCACVYDKHCDIDEYLKHYICVRSNIDDLVITCDKIMNTTETVSISSNYKKNNI